MVDGEWESAPSPFQGEGWGEGKIICEDKAHPRNLKLVGIAKTLRKRQTDSETKLWYQLRDRRLENTKFRRQYPIKNYVVDFICTDKMLIIELDGGQHADNKKDVLRDNWLKSEGYRILRFWNSDVLQNMEAVLQVIMDTLNDTTSGFYPHPVPLPERERGKQEERREV